jgi:hypothetical protein
MLYASGLDRCEFETLLSWVKIADTQQGIAASGQCSGYLRPSARCSGIALLATELYVSLGARENHDRMLLHDAAF